MANPTTTVAQLTTLMLSWLDDPNAGYFDAATTLVWLNMAQREVQKQLIMAGENYYLADPVETLTVYGQAGYKLPTDFLKEHRIEIIMNGTGANETRQALSVITLNEQDMTPITLGDPMNYYIQKDFFVVSPTPQTANLTMRLYYSYRIADLVNTSSVPDIPEEFQEYIALLAAYNGFIKDDRAPENLMGKIGDYKERLKQMAEDRTQDSSRRIVVTEDWQSGGYF